MLKKSNRSLIVVGEPIPFDCFDKQGRELLKAGTVVNQKQMDALLERGLFFEEEPVAVESLEDASGTASNNPELSGLPLNAEASGFNLKPISQDLILDEVWIEEETGRSDATIFSKESKQSAPNKENRVNKRYHASWRVAVAIEGYSSRAERTIDISKSGVSIMSHFNLKPGLATTLHIFVPPKAHHEHKVIRVHGVTQNTVHDSKHNCFRVGIAFEKFDVEADREFLEARLESHNKVK